MEYKSIELNEWERTGEGASASSYVKKGDDMFGKKVSKGIFVKINETFY